MKKIISTTLFFCLSIFAIGAVHAFDMVDLMVTNVSQNNQDALLSGAYPGDVLKFDIDVSPLDGGEPNVEVDVSDVLSKSQIIDKGFGELSGDYLIFPAFEGSEMSFFVRVNESCSAQDSSIEVFAHGTSIRVDLICDNVVSSPVTPTQPQDPILPSTGTPIQTNMIISIVLGIMILIGFSFVLIRPKND